MSDFALIVALELVGGLSFACLAMAPLYPLLAPVGLLGILGGVAALLRYG